MTEPWNQWPHSDGENALSGLVPTRDYSRKTNRRADGCGRDASALANNLLSTMPVFLAGSMAVSMTLTGAVTPAIASPVDDAANSKGNSVGNVTATRGAVAQSRHTQLANNLTGAAPVNPAPGLYTVARGDTVSNIAARFGLPTSAVLAMNGLGWKSVIFPGQTLRLTTSISAPAREPVVEKVSLSVTQYTIVRGDSISQIAARFGVRVEAVLDANRLSRSSLIFPGQVLAIPINVLTNPAPIVPSHALAPETVRSEPVIPQDIRGSAQPSPSHENSHNAKAESIDNEVRSTNDAATTPAPTPTPTPADPPVASTPPPVSAPQQSTTYVIKSGDTLSKIAASFGISLASLYAANGLSASTIIYTGSTLIIPTGSAPAAVGGSVTLLTAEGEANARIIIAIGRELGVSDYGIVIALATAMQESTMRNLNYGHLDSVGLFQQRPVSGWGTVQQLTTPTHAARLFYGGPSNPNKGKTRGLLDIAGWQSMALTQAAQKVQISAYPNAYAKWETSARHWLSTL